MRQRGGRQRFAVLKHRLFEKVLDALESFQRTSDEEMGLRHDFNRAQVLLSRGMNRVGVGILLKAQKRAQSIEAHDLMVEAETMLLRAGHLSEESADISSACIERVKEEHELIHIRHNLFRSIRDQGRKRTEVGIATSLIQERLMQSIEEKGSSTRAHYLAHHGLAALLFAKNEIVQSFSHVSSCIELIQKNEHLKYEFPMALTDMLANSCYIHMRVHEEEKAYACLSEILEIDSDSMKKNEVIQYSGSLLQSMLFYLNRVEDINLHNRLEIELSFYEAHRWEYPAEIRAGIDYGLGLLRHQEGNRASGLKCLNRILNDGEIHRDTDVYHRTLVLATVFHIESGDREWMAHSARALKRYLKPRGLLKGVESLLLDYIADHRRSRSDDGEERALRQFVHRLRSIRRAPEARLSFEYFDFLAWAEVQLGDEDHTSLVA